jgi:tetratricopeptide (TPR) repeat protein
MRGTRHAGFPIAAAILLALAIAPGRPVFAEGQTKVKGKIVDNQGKPLGSVKLFFEAVDIKKRVGPVYTNKNGDFVIATLDITVAKKWKVIPELAGYKIVKVSYEIIDSEQNERGKGDVLMSSKQDNLPELLFTLVGDEGRNVVNLVLAKEAEFLAASQAERTKRTTDNASAAGGPGAAGAVPPVPGTGPAASAPGAPGAPAPAPAAAPAPVIPPGGKEMLEKAKQFTDAGRHQEAVPLYRAYLAKDPTGHPEVYYYLGKSLFESDDLPAASQAFSKGLELKADLKGSHYYLGNIALKGEQPAAAIAEYEKEVPFSPDFDPLFLNMGVAYTQIGDDAKALAAFDKSATLNPTKPEPLMQMASIYDKQRDQAKTPEDKKAAGAKSDEMYDRIKAIDPKNAAILFFNVGAKAKNENRSKDAVQAFRKSVEIDPTYAPAHKELGYALVGTQDFSGAIKQFEEYLKLNPQAPDAKDIKQTIAALR